MDFMNYSQIFSGQGGLLSTISDPNKIIEWSTNLASQTAWGIYRKNHPKAPNKGNLPSALSFLLGDNIVSDLISGGYQPHVGAYIAHKVGMATFSGLSAIKNQLLPGSNVLLQKEFNRLSKKEFDDRNISDDMIKQTLSSFATLNDIHPQKFQEVFFREFKSAYLTSDRYLCVLEKDENLSQEFEKKHQHNNHYQSFLVKNVTVPSTEVENISINRFGQSFSVMGNSGTTESISVNYFIDKNNSIVNKLFQHLSVDSYMGTDKYFNMYIIIHNPYFSNLTANNSNDNILKNAVSKYLPGKISLETNSNLITVRKYSGVHVKNINQLTYDYSSGNDFATLPVIFNHNGVQIYNYDEYDKILNHYDWNDVVERWKSSVYV